MELNLNGASAGAAQSPEPAPGQEEYQQYDIQADRDQMTLALASSPEVDALTSQIEAYNMESIVTFGSRAAEEISRCSDVMLKSMSMSQLDDSSTMLTSLAKVMERFDINEIKENTGFFGKLFGNARKQMDRIVAKYHKIGRAHV